GKQCLACFQGEWLLMFDGGTNECCLVSLASLSRISLPPLLTPLENLYMCALSSPTLPDCTIMFTTERTKDGGDDDDDDDEERYLVYYRPGDEEWWELLDETDGTYDAISNEIVGCQGTMYVRTNMYTFITVNALLSSFIGASIERRGIPHPSTMRWGHNEHLVESDGDVFLLQFYTHGTTQRSSTWTFIDWTPRDTYVWEKVESIGDRTIFVISSDCVVLSSASRAGIQPGRIHLLHGDCYDGIRLYTIRLDDRTMSCSLLPRSFNSMSWVVPSSLPVELVEELVPRISFIDYLNVRQVCQGWSLISRPTQYGRRYQIYPTLLSICSSSVGVFKLFDPIVEKEYTMKSSSLVPYTMARPEFAGISFSSPPNSPNCIVCSIHKERASNPAYSNTIYVVVWRTGDKELTEKEIGAKQPYFLHGEFYCPGTRGSLGIFNPNNMTWRVLDKPDPILVGDPMPGEHYCHLLEFRDDLIVIFRPHDKGPIDLYKFDKSQMV
uniref:KIB1-4 beta-propeller domain-containing protein n=1 Tax=Setaria italica TaxID=4555 RepID=K3XSE3_SETIT